MKSIYDALFYSVYFAPRGGERLLKLGDELAQRHLNHSDKLIGIVGDAGSGKSSIIQGMFPGLHLTNDDDAINPAKLMQMRLEPVSEYKQLTYHIDMRFQMAFTQMFEIVDFVNGALKAGRRVIVEHFDLLYPYLNLNAHLLIGIGEEIIVTRPSLFGPLPSDIYKIVFESVKLRKTIHTAEDLTFFILRNKLEYLNKIESDDVRGGFALRFEKKPDFDIKALEDVVKKYISRDMEVSYFDESHIKIGENVIECNGPRIHAKRTSDIKNFRFLSEFIEDRGDYYLVGLLCNDRDRRDINKIFMEAKE